MNKLFLSALLATGCYVPPNMEIDELSVYYQDDVIYTASSIMTLGLPQYLEDFTVEVTVNDLQSYDEYCFSDNQSNLLCSASLVYDYSFACGTAVNYTIVVEYEGVEYEMSQMVTPDVGDCI